MPGLTRLPRQPQRLARRHAPPADGALGRVPGLVPGRRGRPALPEPGRAGPGSEWLPWRKGAATGEGEGDAEGEAQGMVVGVDGGLGDAHVADAGQVGAPREDVIALMAFLAPREVAWFGFAKKVAAEQNALALRRACSWRPSSLM
jgi:hypothetical protein